jgi:uncharacterized protein
MVRTALALALSLLFSGCSLRPGSDYPISDVPLTAVKFSDGFWAPRQRTDVAVTIAHQMKQTEETGRIKNFELAAAALQGATGAKCATRFAFDDSDVYKLMEAASYTLMLQPNPALENALEAWAHKIAAAQEPDGYLYTARTINPASPLEMSGPQRWVKLQDSHELYNLGHLYEAAVAYHQATGKRTLLDIALESADFISRTFGPGKDQLKLVPGHEEIEIGLVKLYRATGRSKYLELAKFFVDQRGNAAGHKLYGEYNQDHKPVVDQREAVGHAVRAAYLYSGVADVAALTADQRYLPALESIWEDIVSKKLYLTGGIGAAGGIEGFGPAYELPNETGYAETCATIAFALWNYRMFRLHGDAKYMDLFERAAYNAFLSGSGLSGDRYFYPNPLASFGQHERSAWFSCACCPPNVARFIAEMGSFAYAAADKKVFVNLYVQGTAAVTTDSGAVHLEQSTEYPWSGEIKIRVSPHRAAQFALMLRVPGWAQGRPLPSDLYHYLGDDPAPPVVRLNGEKIAYALEKGYARIDRTWNRDDTVEVFLPMTIRRVIANDNVKADAGRIAVERGPFVYCAEWVDNNGAATNLVLGDSVPLTAELRTDIAQGVATVTGEATAYRYTNGSVTESKQKLVLIPYYAWAHRGRGEMAVWLARERGKARPTPEPTTASTASVTGSDGVRGLEGIHNLREPERSSDAGSGYAHWWPKKGTTEWVQYDFESPVSLSESSVYWFDDTGEGECRVPVSWKILYKEGGRWQPVKSAGPFDTGKDRYNRVRFAPVRTTALRLELQMPAQFSAGLQEWTVK